MQVPPAEEIPQDEHDCKLQDSMFRQGLTLSNEQGEIFRGKKMYSDKQYMEARLGKFGHNSESTRKFLENDGRVLRFYCRLSNPESSPDNLRYTIHYYLSDETVQVCESHEQNSGRDPFPSLLRRQKLPKDWLKHLDREKIERYALLFFFFCCLFVHFQSR